MRNRQTVLFRLIFGVALSAAAGAPHALELPAAISETLASNPELQAERREADARNREVRSAKGGFLPEVELLGGYGHQEWEPAGSNRSTDLERSEAQLSVRQRVDDVLLERVVAERLRDHDIDARRVLHLRRVARHEMARPRSVFLDGRRGDARDLRGLVHQHLARAELCRHDADQPRAGADVGDGGLAAPDDPGERVMEGLIADAVGDQRAMVFDAHWARCQAAAAGETGAVV